MRHKRRRLQRQRKKTWLAIVRLEELRGAVRQLHDAILQHKAVLI
jgi:hypothetical protein